MTDEDPLSVGMLAATFFRLGCPRALRALRAPLDAKSWTKKAARSVDDLARGTMGAPR